MSEPKFKIGDRVKWADSYGNQRRGVVSGETFNECCLVKEAQELKPGTWYESSLSLDALETPKFNIGDRVKFTRFVIGVITLVGADDCYSIDSWDRCISKIPGADLSREVPGPGAFKVGDRVKYTRPSGNIGIITQGHADNHYSVQTGDGCVTRVPGGQMSLDVPAPKQFATKLEAELGAEIIKLHYDAADLDARLTKAIGAGHRERIAKEAAQKELAEVRPALARERAILADIYTAMLKQYI